MNGADVQETQSAAEFKGLILQSHSPQDPGGKQLFESA